MTAITLQNGARVSLGAYVAAWRAVKAQPETIFTGWDDFPRAGSDIRADMLAGLHDRINRRGALRVPANGIHWYALKRDQRAIRDYRLHRIVRRGSGLETAEARRVAPDVHATFTSRDY